MPETTGDHVRLHSEPYTPYNPAQAAQRSANWERNLATIRNRPERERWNGVRE